VLTIDDILESIETTNHMTTRELLLGFLFSMLDNGVMNEPVDGQQYIQINIREMEDTPEIIGILILT
jgi:hypothetical protein